MSIRYTLTLLAVGVAASAVLVVAPFVWYLRALPISTTTSEPWAYFASYFSGMLSPILALLNLLLFAYIAIQITELQQTTLAAKRLSLDLYNEWHAEALHRSRRVIDAMVTKLKTAQGQLPTLSQFERDDSEDSTHVFRVYHFFEKWALLSRERQIDGTLLINVLATYTKWWEESFLKPLALGETNNDYCKTLALIEAEVLAKSPHRTLSIK